MQICRDNVQICRDVCRFAATRIQHSKALDDVLILLSCEDSIPMRSPAAPHDHTCTRLLLDRSSKG